MATKKEKATATQPKHDVALAEKVFQYAETNGGVLATHIKTIGKRLPPAMVNEAIDRAVAELQAGKVDGSQES